MLRQRRKEKAKKIKGKEGDGDLKFTLFPN